MRGLFGLDGLSTRATLGVVLACLVTPLVHWISLGPEVPQISYVQLTGLPPVADLTDPSDILYSFLRPPIYELLGWVYTVPAAFILMGLVSHGVLNLLVFALARRGLERSDAPPMSDDPTSPSATRPRFANWMLALVVALTIYPVGLALGITGWGTTLVPHDTYFTFSFQRTFFWILAVLGYRYAVERKWGAAFFALAASCYPHPSAGVTAFGMMTLVVLPRLVTFRDRRFVLVWAAAAFVGALPNLTKYALVELPAELHGTVPYGEWYSHLIKDEADDFSMLFQLACRGPRIASIFSTIAALLVAYAWTARGWRRSMSFWCALGVPGLFLLSALAEYLFAARWPTPLVHPIAAMTLGYRLLSYAFPPLVVIAARVLASVVARVRGTPPRHPARLVGALVVAVWLAFLALGLQRGLVGPSLAYARWAASAGTVEGIDQYFAATRDAGANRYFQPACYLGADAFERYPGERDVFTIAAIDRTQPERVVDESYEPARSLEAFEEIVAAVRAEIPEREGLYVPQQMRHFRDALPKHPIFLQEHPDGNLMVISGAVMRFWLDRMRDLLDLTYEDMPSKDSGRMYTCLRNAYLAIDDERLALLWSKYPAYRWFVTERQHELSYPKVIETSAFVVYDLAGGDGGAER